VPEDSAEASTVGKIIKLANRCKIIIRGLLDFARKDTPERELVDLNAVIREMLNLIEGHVIMRQIKVELVLDQLPPFYGHRSKLEQVFLNMVVNAAESMEGKGNLRIKTEADELEQVIRLKFEDTGPGIPEDVAQRIFEPFFTTKGRGRGTGLGLAISHGIIQQHYGKIEVDTKIGEGTKFTITLPFRHPGSNPATGK
jgi:signal transduction histidine kinase